MKLIRLLLAALLLMSQAPTALADATLQVTDAWIREAPPGAGMLAGYLTLANTGDTPIVVEAVSSPAFAAVEIHQSLVEDGIARMLPVEALTVPPHGTLRLEPGGYHLMLMHPAQPLAAGENVVLRLQPADGACVTVTATVRRQLESDAHHHHH